MASMRYGPVTDADFETAVANLVQAFNVPLTSEREWMSRPEHRSGLRALYVNEQIVSQAVLLDLELLTAGPVVRCTGLASVATPPEQRRRGYTSSLLRHICDESLSQGVVLSMLFPFKQSFYDQFGWASSCERSLVSGPPALFQSFRQVAGQWSRVSTADIPELDIVYETALQGRFGPINRTPHWWENYVLRGFNQEYQGYLWRDEQGRARSYVFYMLENRSNQPGRALRCREAVALDPTARAQIFAFLGNHDSQCSEIFLRTPADAPLQALMPDPLKYELQPHFMLRLLDVPAALQALHYPGDQQGRLTLRVHDAWLSHNDGLYALEFEAGHVNCLRLPATEQADLELDVRILTQIYTRYLRPRSAAAFGLLEVSRRPALALLDRLFSGLLPFNSDYF